MGFTPAQVNAMGLWEFMACCEGYRVGNGGKPEPTEIDDDLLREFGIAGFD